jgi:hypothetical protein
MCSDVPLAARVLSRPTVTSIRAVKLQALELSFRLADGTCRFHSNAPRGVLFPHVPLGSSVHPLEEATYLLSHPEIPFFVIPF